MMSVLTSLQDSALSTWLRESESFWALPAMLLFHTTGMGILVGTSWALDLRLLGVARGIPIEPLRPLFRAMWVGFAINAVTGVLLFAQEAASKGTSITFIIKMLFVLLGMVTVVLLQRDLFGGANAAIEVSARTKRLARISLIVWTIAITAGRLLGYIPIHESS
jgi:hypothetical protein